MGLPINFQATREPRGGQLALDLFGEGRESGDTLRTEGDKSANQALAPSDLVKRIHNDIRDSREVKTAWLKQAEECDNFYNGHQWDREDVDIMRKDKRPIVVFNRAQTVINAILGAELNNRREVRFEPRQPDRPEAQAFSELAGSVVEWAMELTSGHDERSLAFRDMMVRGMGWAESRVSYDEDPDGRIVHERIDGRECYWDSASVKQNLEDTRWRARKKWIPIAEALERWPEHELEISAVALAPMMPDDDMPTFLRHRTDQYTAENTLSDSGMRHRDFVPIIQYQYWDMEPYYRAVDPFSKELVVLTPDEYAALRQKVEEHNQAHALSFEEAKLAATLAEAPLPQGGPAKLHVRGVQQHRRRYRQAIVLGELLLEHDDLAIQDNFTLNCMTGFYDTKEHIWYGYMRVMLDPQKAMNKWLSQGLHMVNANAKGGILAEQDAFVNPRKAEADWARGDVIIWLNEGGAQKIQPREPFPFPASFAQLLQYAVTSFREVVAVGPEMLGVAEDETPGVTGRQRVAAGMAVLTPLFNALSRFRKTEARVLLGLIREFIADGRLVRVGNQFSGQAVPLLKDKLAFDYELVLDESPQSPNTKMEVWQQLAPIMPMLIKMGMFVPDLLDFTPLPSSVTAKLKMQLQQMMQQAQQPDPAELGQFESPEEIAARVEKLKAEAALSLAKAQQIMSELQQEDPEQLTRLVELAAKQQDAAVRAEQQQQNMQAEAMRDALHMRSVQQDVESKQQRNEFEREKFQRDSVLEVIKALADIARKGGQDSGNGRSGGKSNGGRTGGTGAGGKR